MNNYIYISYKSSTKPNVLFCRQSLEDGRIDRVQIFPDEQNSVMIYRTSLFRKD